METNDNEEGDVQPAGPWGHGNLLMAHEVIAAPEYLALTQDGTTTARWFFADWAGDSLGPHLDVGILRWVIADLAEGVGPLWDELDASGADEETMGSALRALEADGQLLDADCALMLMHAGVPREARGTGLGPLLAQEFARFAVLGRQDPVALVYPQPDGWQDMKPELLYKTQEKLRAAWGRLGFEPVAGVPGVLLARAREILLKDVRSESAPWLWDGWGAG